MDTLLRADILDFTDIDKMRAMQDVFKILKTKVGSPISYSNIAGDIGIAPTTVKKYIEVLEAMYVIFIVRPYTKKVRRAILKEPKIYFYDNGLVEGDEGVKFENLVANALLKSVLGRRDF